MSTALRILVASLLAFCSGGWLILCALIGVAYGLTSWSTSPLDAVLGFTAALLFGGAGVAVGCLVVQSLPERLPEQQQPRGFEVLPPR